MMNLEVTKKAAVKQKVLSEIVSGGYLPGQKLAGEGRLAAKMAVSRGTLRLALDELTREGVLKRVRRSGTYVNLSDSHALVVDIPVEQPDTLLVKHWWGKLLEHAHRGPQKIALRQVPFEVTVTTSRWAMHQLAVKLFSAPEPVGLLDINMNDLGWLVEAGFCADLTAKVHSWPQADNLYQVALDAVTYQNKIYALPSNVTLTGLAYHERLLEQAGFYPPEVGSFPNFFQMVEKCAKSSQFKYSFWAPSSRTLVMHLLGAFYSDLRVRFEGEDEIPIEREIALEVLTLVQRLKWQLRGIIPFGSAGKTPDMELWHDFTAGRIPMCLTLLAPGRHYQELGARDEDRIRFAPLSFSSRHRPFSFFNCRIVILNPRTDELVREFLWSFLKEYLHPQSQYELDRRCLEEGKVNTRVNAFIRGIPRVPADPEFQESRKELFRCAEPEIPFPSPAFDFFVSAASRMLLDCDANAGTEYEYYLRMMDGAGDS